MKILVTGGAGYIGSVCVTDLIELGHDVVVIDNLSNGRKEILNKKAQFYEIDLIDKNKVNSIFKKEQFDIVFHFAAYKAVGESMANACKYSDNIVSTINLLNAIVENNVKKIIFSSSAAVYGNPNVSIVTEETSTNPINFYGYTKLENEKLIQWYSDIHNIDFTILRYFNVAGDVLGYLDHNAQNIFPIIFDFIFKKRDSLTIFGNDYNTRDGTCIRDYIHIKDLVRAHILALNKGKKEIINLGTNKGTSVKELISIFEKTLNLTISFKYGDRRLGDPESLIASNEKAQKILLWNTNYNLDNMIKSMYKTYLEYYNS